ncbi:TadE/TadG family type IV pilus assembly protein [Halanaerobacter jeridensis]|uniref:Flp pilus assembly protein TadG n=1 Tax=Halanaerobacter jeridensis TaxID=706427 RepID=A0A939BSJ0_9FIRM|nr:TadE/TadG family type IV pilus assembly protein [Halanaerobacter jeridensis]MBM7557196.1 Flp pilus assembly protein TadG [Halanaerobacter jeridensis]
MFIKLAKDETAQAMVELALVLPVLLLVLFGIVEFGRIFHSYLVIANAARVGARVGAIENNDSQIVSAVNNAVAPSNFDVNRLNINITPSQSNRSSGDSLTVEVEYGVDLFVPLITNLLPDPFPISSTMVMRVE